MSLLRQRLEVIQARPRLRSLRSGGSRWAHWPRPIKTPLWSSDAYPPEMVVPVRARFETTSAEPGLFRGSKVTPPTGFEVISHTAREPAWLTTDLSSRRTSTLASRRRTCFRPAVGRWRVVKEHPASSLRQDFAAPISTGSPPGKPSQREAVRSAQGDRSLRLGASPGRRSHRVVYPRLAW
jgi:hypothetical protein